MPSLNLHSEIWQDLAVRECLYGLRGVAHGLLNELESLLYEGLQILVVPVRRQSQTNELDGECKRWRATLPVWGPTPW